jgi:hypothetical protein
VNGFQADVVALSLAPDVDTIKAAGLITQDWTAVGGADKGMVSSSVAVLDVRPNNPKHLTNWNDLTQGGLQILTPDPAQSGGARWNIVAAYGAEQQNQVPGYTGADGAEKLLQGIFTNVTVLDKSARDSIKNFEAGNGDVAITYENEVKTANKAGLPDEAVYPPATVLTAETAHQDLARGFTVGMRFHSAPVVRLADAKPMHLGHAARADGAWRIYAFADASGQRLRALADFLGESPDSPVRRFTPAGADIDSVIDVRAVFQQGHRDLKVEELPSILLPRKGRFGLIDYEKAYCPDLKNGPDIFELRGIDREKGAIVVVRPDQYVANVLPLDAHDELTAFFGRFLLDRQ